MDVKQLSNAARIIKNIDVGDGNVPVNYKVSANFLFTGSSTFGHSFVAFLLPDRFLNLSFPV